MKTVLCNIDHEYKFFDGVFRGFYESNSSQYYTGDRYNNTFGGALSNFSCMTSNIRRIWQKNMKMLAAMLRPIAKKH